MFCSLHSGTQKACHETMRIACMPTKIRIIEPGWHNICESEAWYSLGCELFATGYLIVWPFFRCPLLTLGNSQLPKTTVVSCNSIPFLPSCPEIQIENLRSFLHKFLLLVCYLYLPIVISLLIKNKPSLDIFYESYAHPLMGILLCWARIIKVFIWPDSDGLVPKLMLLALR